MTFSLCVFDPPSGQFGVGAITAMPGVGKLVSHARAGVGATATQAMINPYLGIDGLALLAAGSPAPEARDAVIQQDQGRDHRQFGLVDRGGRAAAWSGSQIEEWSGHLAAEGIVTQGNRLVGPETLEAVMQTYQQREDLDVAHRLLHALEAGESTGADKKGALSGTIYVVDTEDYPLWDVRVDYADDPAAALRELVGIFDESLVPQVKGMSTRADYVGEMTRQQMAE